MESMPAGFKKNNQESSPQVTVEEKERFLAYSGLFIVDNHKLLSLFPPKHEVVYAHHSTNEFRPQSTDSIEIGKRYLLKIIGRVADEKGDALLVDNPKSKNAHPHITLSCAPGVSPVYSNEMIKSASQNGTIDYFSEPVYIEAVEGYENGNQRIITEDQHPAQ